MLRFRQVHLDFHTSEKIAGVGSRFDKAQFQQMLKRGHVDSVTLFSKCHHGMTYHDTTVGARHPGMNAELLPSQIEACREIDVRVPIYISAGLDEHMARLHPEWLVVNRDGKTFDPLKPGFKVLCFNTPYLDYLCAQIDEVIDRFDGGDGIFLDIIAVRRCFCACCMVGMESEKLDPNDEADVNRYQQGVLRRYYERATASCKRGDENRRVFHNSGHIPKGAHQVMKWNSHLELESLPTGGWGYDHFPVSAKYAATTGFDFLGMTGKFHTSWGEFGGYKRANALRYECAAMLAFGSKCSIGDQLHPDGQMNEDTYNLIGAAYEEVEAKQAWCDDAEPVSEIALVSTEAMRAANPDTNHRDSSSEEGASRMLLELHAQFDVVDLDRDLSAYKLVILPDEITLEGTFKEKIEAYLEGGGKLILSGHSGMNAEQTGFAIPIGLEVVGRGEFDPDYICPTALMPTSPARGRFVIHGGAFNVRATDDKMQVLAERAEPYFNREWNHFCSHQHTPDATHSEFASVVGNDSIVYFAHEIFTRYRLYGQPLYRDLVQDAIAHLLKNQLVCARMSTHAAAQEQSSTPLPSAARVSLMRQAQSSRYMLHLLYATPSLRGGKGANAQSLEVIEDLVPLHDIECTVRVPETVSSVKLAPSGEELDFTTKNGALRFVVPRLLCHQMVELSY